MKKTWRILLTVLLLVCFLICAFLMLQQMRAYKKGAESAKLAAELAAEPETVQPDLPSGQIVPMPQHAEETTKPEVMPETPPQPKEPEQQWIPAPVEGDRDAAKLHINLKSLRKVNPEVIGWIHIPDTVLDYPLVQTEDNDHYLNTTWDHYKLKVGAIFADYRNAADLTDSHTLVYGHNLKDGTMFSLLLKYSDTSYWKRHPYIYVVQDGGILRYEVYAAFEANVSDCVYDLSLTREEKEAMIRFGLEQSAVDTGVTPAATDRILTLSTCTELNERNTRWVVQARLPMIPLEEETTTANP